LTTVAKYKTKHNIRFPEKHALKRQQSTE